MTENELRGKVVATAAAFVGAKRGDERHKDLIDTYNSYRPLPRGYKVKYTDAWCAAAVSAWAIKAGAVGIFPIECSCDRQRTLLQKAGAWVEDGAYVPRPGDIIFYDWQDDGKGDNTGSPDHVGIVEACDGKTITVIDGNKSGAVGRRKIAVNGKCIRGFGAPDYGKLAKEEPVSAAQTEETAEPLFGVDVSRWQGNFDFNRAKAEGARFAIIKAGGGDDGLYKDSKFESNYKNARASGVSVGAYFFGHARTVDEADKFVDIVRGKTFEYPLFYDVEASMLKLGKAPLTDIIVAFCEKVEAAGYRAGVYASESPFNSRIDDKRLSKYDHWVAKYSKAAPALKSGNKVCIWQFGGSQNFIRDNRVAGVTCDQNYCYVDCGTSTATPSKQETTPAPAVPDTKPDTPSATSKPSPGKIAKGDTVRFMGGYHYSNSAAARPTGGRRTAGKAKVTHTVPGRAHPYHLEGVPGGSNVYGWVDAKDVE